MSIASVSTDEEVRRRRPTDKQGDDPSSSSALPDGTRLALAALADSVETLEDEQASTPEPVEPAAQNEAGAAPPLGAAGAAQAGAAAVARAKEASRAASAVDAAAARALAERVVREGSRDDPYVNSDEILQGLKASGLNVELSREQVDTMVNAYSNGNVVLDAKGVQALLQDGVISTDGNTARFQHASDRMLAPLAKGIIEKGSKDDKVVNGNELREGLRAMGFEPRFNEAQLAFMAKAYADAPWFDEKQVAEMIEHGAIRLTGGVAAYAPGPDSLPVAPVGTDGFGGAGATWEAGPPPNPGGQSWWQRGPETWFKEAEQFAADLGNAVRRGEEAAQSAVHKLVDKVIEGATGIPGKLQQVAAAVQGQIADITKKAEAQLGELSDAAFDTMWRLQTGGDVPATRGRGLIEFAGAAGTGLYLQARLAGKLAGVVDGLDLNGNVRVTLPLASTNATLREQSGEALGYIGKDKAVRFNLTGELNVGKSADDVSVTGGVEIDVAFTATANGIRVDSVGVNAIVDEQAGKVIEKLLGVFHGAAGPQAAALTRQPSNDDFADAASDFDSDFADAASDFDSDFEDALSQLSEDGSVYFDAVEEVIDSVDGVEEVTAAAGDAPAASFARRDKVFQAELAASLRWVNSDYASADPGFQPGWRHGGGAPDQFALIGKGFSGVKEQLGSTNLYGEVRVMNVSSGGLGMTFSEAGRRTFGREVTDWNN